MPGSISASCAFTPNVVFESANPARHTHVSASHWSCWPSASDGPRPKADILLPIVQWSWAGFHWKDKKTGKFLLHAGADPVSQLDQEAVRSPALFSQLMVARRLAGSTSYNSKEGPTEALPVTIPGAVVFPPWMHQHVSQYMCMVGSWTEPYHPWVNWILTCSQSFIVALPMWLNCLGPICDLTPNWIPWKPLLRCQHSD